jgi:trk system potassium uptake protein
MRLSRLFLRILSRSKNIPSHIKKIFEGGQVDTLLNQLKTFYTYAIPALSVLTLVYLIYDVGYNDFNQQKRWLYNLWKFTYWLIAILFCVRLVFSFKEMKRWSARIFNFSLIGLTLFLVYLIDAILESTPGSRPFFLLKIFLFTAASLIIFIEGSNIVRSLYNRALNASLLFVASFFLLIVVGAFLLMLPNATTNGISPIDAFFTSASAVCVTGLIVVDTATAFTTFGKVIIITLVQIGGLGIMTFAGILGYLASGSVSVTNQVALKDMVSSNRLGNIMAFVGRVIIVTISFEAIGAILIYLTIPTEVFNGTFERIFFAGFHGISAFCNAGFSTFTDGLFDQRVRFNYPFQGVIIVLIVLGGIGFPILFNIAAYVRTRTKNFFCRIMNIPQKEYFAHIMHTSSRIALATTFILLILGFVSYFILERNATLTEHTSITGKLVTSLFGSVTPRTAGFNTVNLTQMTFPTVMIYLLLMYIGASPGSTGGGIKTTVAAVAFLNMKSIVIGSPRTEVFRTQISEASINRAFAIIILSLLVLGLSILLVSLNDSEKGLLKIAFEVFSAFSTVGLTLGITADLSALSKLVLSLVMLVGRVGTITLLVAFISSAKAQYYRYPTEDVLL